MNHRGPHHLFTFTTVLAVGGFTLIALDGVTLPEAAGLQPGGPLLETPNPAGTPMPVDPGIGEDPDPSPNCKQTEVAGTCGTNQNIGTVTCGTQTCPLEVISYGQMLNCQGGQSIGWEKCKFGQCKKITRTYSCVATEDNSVECKFTDKTENVLPITFADSAHACELEAAP